MTSVAEVLAGIPAASERLDADDNFLRQTIRHVETALNAIAPGVVTSFRYARKDEDRYTVLSFEPSRLRWIVTWHVEGEPMATPLLNTSRQARAEVFMPVFHDGLSPIEYLVLEIANNLAKTTIDRGPALEVAKRLSTTLTAAGYTIGV